MGLKVHQVGELVGLLLVFVSTAAQIFYLEPIKREIEWRLTAFNIQQTGQVQAKAVYDSRVAILRAVNAPADAVKAAETEGAALLARYKTADADIADVVIAKQDAEDLIQIIVMALFALGSALVAFGRAMEMRDARRG